MAACVWVVIPTYNEVQNLESIVLAADQVLAGEEVGGHRILIVDDNSPDGTGRVADDLAARMETVCVLHRPGKAGLGQAYLAGFAHALAEGAQTVVEMDADHSHDPKYLPQLLAATATADLVLGSRYVKGGRTVNWGPVRRLVSRGGGLYARAVLGVEVNDLTGGFKAIRRHALEAIDLHTVRAEGYVFQIEVTYRAILAGCRVVEVPITFTDRAVGASKMSSRIAIEAMLLVPLLRWRLSRRMPGRPPMGLGAS